MGMWRLLFSGVKVEEHLDKDRGLKGNLKRVVLSRNKDPSRSTERHLNLKFVGVML